MMFSRTPFYTQADRHIKEFQIFIHKREGFVNAFMLSRGQPHIIVPGFDSVRKFQRPEQLHYIIK